MTDSFNAALDRGPFDQLARDGSLLQAPIFIVGLNKSGTSLLYLLMSQHEQLSAIKALKAPKPNKPGSALLHMEEYGIGEGQKISDLPQKLRASDGSNRFACPEFISLYRLTEADVSVGDAERVTAAYRGAMAKPGARLCEKSPPNLVRTRYLQALFPDAIFIVVVRDPYANVSANARRRTKWGSLEDQARHWAGAYSTWLEDRAFLHRSLVVRYERLVSDGDDVVGQVCAFCGIPPVAAQHSTMKIEQDLNDQLLGLLSPDDYAMITRICGPTMQALDYPVRKAESDRHA